MLKRGFVRRAEDWTEVARWLGVYWGCRCCYSNVASYRCYFCGCRAPADVRSLVADTLRAANQVEVAPKTPLADQPRTPGQLLPVARQLPVAQVLVAHQ